MANNDLISETWKTIPIAPNYEASSLGIIRRSRPGASKMSRVVVGRVLLPCRAGPRRTYLSVNLEIDGRCGQKSVHRLIALTFLGAPPTAKHHAAHINGDSFDNRAVNLRWSSPSENERDKLLHGRHNRGERTASHKLTERQVLEIRASELPQSAIANRYGVAQTTISKIKRRVRWAWLK